MMFELSCGSGQSIGNHHGPRGLSLPLLRGVTLMTGHSKIWLCNKLPEGIGYYTINSMGYIYMYIYIYCLVVWNLWIIVPYIGNVIIPTDVHSVVFQRGAGQPPTRNDEPMDGMGTGNHPSYCPIVVVTRREFTLLSLYVPSSSLT